MEDEMTQPMNPADSQANEAPVARFITLIHDAYGEVSIPYDQLAELHPEVTVLRAMASASSRRSPNSRSRNAGERSNRRSSSASISPQPRASATTPRCAAASRRSVTRNNAHSAARSLIRYRSAPC